MNRFALQTLLLVVLGLSSSALFQIEPLAAQDDAGNTAFLPAPRTLRQHLTRAEKAIEERRFNDAVAELGALLAEEQSPDAIEADVNQDFFVGPFTQPAVRGGLKSEAQRLLGAMPEAARDLYELQFGADAKVLLESATRDSDLNQLTEVTRKYFHTRAGYEATMLLGRLELDRGHPLAAAMCFRRLATTPAAANLYEPELTLLLASCWIQAGRLPDAAAALDALRGRASATTLEIAGQRITQLPLAAEAQDWLRQQLGTVPGGTQRSTTDWVMFRGDGARNAASAGGAPLPSFRWRVPTAGDPADERLIDEVRAEKFEQRTAALPSLQPLAVDDVVLMRTSSDRLLAIDFASGKRVWEYPWWSTSSDDVSLTGRTNMGTDEGAARRERLYQRLWQDNPYGQISSDGQAVYMLDQLRDAILIGGQFMAAPRFRFANPDAPRRHNELVSLDLRRQGSLRWKVGGETGNDEPQLANAFFLGPPLPMSGALYAIAEINGEVRLVVLDALTGRLAWSQQLSHVEGDMIMMSPSRRLFGATPSFADGVLLCPTSTGALVAIDVATRSLLWGYQYELRELQQPFGFAQPFSGREEVDDDRWLDASIVMADGAVLLTPPESDKLICLDLDLASGKPRWVALRRENADVAGGLFVACVQDGKAIVVCKHKVVALRLADGKPAWSKPLELQVADGEMPSGRGFLSQGSYYLPTTASHLLQIDLAQGTVVERTRTSEPLGNLICYHDEIVSHSAGQVSAFHQIEPLRRQVEQRLAANADDAWALARQGQLLVLDGRSRDALEILQRAQRLDPQDESTRMLLVSTFLTALREDFAAHQQASEQVRPLIESPAQQAEFLRLTAEGFHEMGDWQRALEAYAQLTLLDPAVLSGEDPSQSYLVRQDDHWSVRLDRWIRTRLEELSAQGTEEVRTRLDEIVRERVGQAAAHNLSELERDASYFGFHPLFAPVKLVLAERWLETDRLLEAEQMLLGMRERADESIAAGASARLAALYAKAGRYDMAVNLYREVGTRWADVTCYPNQTGSEVLAKAMASESLQGEFGVERQWPWGRAAVEERNGVAESEVSLSRLNPLPLEVLHGEALQGWQFALDPRDSLLVGRDASGHARLQVNLANVAPNGLDQGLIAGHLAILYFGNELIALDALGKQATGADGARWRLTVAPPSQFGVGPFSAGNPFERDAITPRGPVDASGHALSSLGPVNSRGLYYQRLRTLICVDPLTGDPLWTRGDVEQGARLFGDDELLFVVPPDADAAHVYRAADGKLVGQRQLPATADRWHVTGRHVLAWDSLNGRFRVYLRDIWSQTDLWSENVSQAAVGKVVDGKQIALLDANGRFVLRSLHSDQVALRAKLEPEAELQNVRVLPLADRYLVFVGTKLPGTEAPGRIVAAAHPNAPLLDARVYAFDRQSGQSLWQVPAVIHEYGLAWHQPTNSPALWLVRGVNNDRAVRAPVNMNDTARTSVLCIDSRTGQILFANDEVPTQANEFNIVVDEGKHTSTLLLPGYSVTVEFTDQPTPPAPPAQTGVASSFDGGVNRLANMAGSVLNALKDIGGGAANDPFQLDDNRKPAADNPFADPFK